MTPGKEEWHLDKKVPLSLIAVLVFQTAGVLYWAATSSARLAALEDTTKAHLAMPAHLQQALNTAEMKTTQKMLVESVGEIKRDIKEINRKLPQQ